MKRILVEILFILALCLFIDNASYATAIITESSTFVLLGIGAISFVGCGWLRRRTVIDTEPTNRRTRQQ